MRRCIDVVRASRHASCLEASKFRKV
jgi:hypothetical protein